MDNNTNMSLPELVFLSQAEQQVYAESTNALMQTAGQSQDISMQIKEKQKEIDKLIADRDALTDHAMKTRTTMIELLSKYAFKYEKNVIGVNPQNNAIIFEGEEALHQMQQHQPEMFAEDEAELMGPIENPKEKQSKIKKLKNK